MDKKTRALFLSLPFFKSVATARAGKHGLGKTSNGLKISQRAARKHEDAVLVCLPTSCGVGGRG